MGCCCSGVLEKMWIRSTVVRSGSTVRPSSIMGQCIWILMAMTHLTFDLCLCSAPRLTPPSAARPRPRLQTQPLRDMSALPWRTVNTAGASVQLLRADRQMDRGRVDRQRRMALLKDAQAEVLRLLLRSRRQLKWQSVSQESRTTTVSGFIDWGPTGTDEGQDERNFTLSSSSIVPSPTLAPTTSSTRQPHRTLTVGTPEPKRSTTTRAPATGETVKPAKPYGDTPGLAVHQIITITVSLIMVIAALITTLVLKNCCAQSGNSRHNSHQRKIHQQEESCQNLTDFTPARVPSKVDIFSAYDSLQCSHECLRGGVPIYTDEMIQQTPVYKSAYNGSRPSPTERQLIPVAFVSEKWFEISC